MCVVEKHILVILKKKKKRKTLLPFISGGVSKCNSLRYFVKMNGRIMTNAAVTSETRLGNLR